MSYCEDYPCCGHTPADPCSAQWYDAPDAFDTSVYPHALCDHESGDCDVEPDDYCRDCGEDECVCDYAGELGADDGMGDFGGEDACFEDALFGGDC